MRVGSIVFGPPSPPRRNYGPMSLAALSNLLDGRHVAEEPVEVVVIDGKRYKLVPVDLT